MAQNTLAHQANVLPLIPSKHTVSEIVFDGACILKGHTVKTNESDNLAVELFDGNPGVHVGFSAVVGSDLFGGLMLGDGFIRIKTHLRIVITGTVGSGFATVYFNNYNADPA